MKTYITPASVVVTFHTEETMVVATSLPVNSGDSSQNIDNSDDIWTQKKDNGFGQTSPWGE